ncbi:unnamed protein product [Protopolystoma xenopodis]|uniref:Uncharacterized protein n=1 Tax=Protopolystoma xenopodis TaxID=117903 RepID=A0A3S5A7G7_9PLAT|nr:unnamed protein product [Protopolystoma xenopodis]
MPNFRLPRSCYDPKEATQRPTPTCTTATSPFPWHVTRRVMIPKNRFSPPLDVRGRARLAPCSSNPFNSTCTHKHTDMQTHKRPTFGGRARPDVLPNRPGIICHDNTKERPKSGSLGDQVADPRGAVIPADRLRDTHAYMLLHELGKQ